MFSSLDPSSCVGFCYDGVDASQILFLYEPCFCQMLHNTTLSADQLAYPSRVIRAIVIHCFLREYLKTRGPEGPEALTLSPQ